MTAPKLNPIEERVLAVLAIGSADFGCFTFAGIASRTRLARPKIRLACRALARKGLAEYHRGLWSEDGRPAGAGYGVTQAGRERADPKIVKRYERREYVY